MWDLLGCILGYVERWQTLITGLIAIGLAWWTIGPIKKQLQLQRDQIEANEKHLEDARIRKAWAVRAGMPDAISAIVSYCKACFRYVEGTLDLVPIPPSDQIAVFKASIEFIDNDTAQSVFELVSFFQVHNSRLGRSDDLTIWDSSAGANQIQR